MDIINFIEKYCVIKHNNKTSKIKLTESQKNFIRFCITNGSKRTYCKK